MYGDFVLSGTIPGPGSISSNISNNVVTLFNISCPLPTLPILEEAEEVFEPNMLDIAYQLSSLDNLGITISNKQDEEKEALDNFTSNVTRDPVTNAYMVGFPWIGSELPSSYELDSNKDIVKSRFL